MSGAVKLYREWLCTDCGSTWEWTSRAKGGKKPKCECAARKVTAKSRKGRGK